MSRVKSIDVETSRDDDLYPMVDSMDFELYGDDPNWYVRDNSPSGDFLERWKSWELLLDMEKRIRKAGRRAMLRKKKKEEEKWPSLLCDPDDKSPMVSGTLKYPKSKPTFRKYMPYVEMGDTEVSNGDPRAISIKNHQYGGVIMYYCGDIPLGCGDIPNTPETRYRLIYERMLGPCQKIPDVLLRIIIEYLLYGEEWMRSFHWRLQLVNGYE